MIGTIDDKINVEVYGGKAYWLSWLFQEGYHVPYAIFLPAMNCDESDQYLSNLFGNNQFLNKLEIFCQNPNTYNVAIRSSGIFEDSRHSSLAGHFKSFVGNVSLEEFEQNIRRVVKSLNISDVNQSEKMGVVIQQMITPNFSGVIFSSNPINGSKTEIVISVIEGFGDSLVSGTASGEDIMVTLEEDSLSMPKYSSDINKNHLLELCKVSKEIEEKLHFPVDIEWCVDNVTHQVFLLQCRPQTGYQFEHVGVIPVLLENKPRIPKIVLHNDKIKLRLLAEENGIKISKAHLVVLNCSEENTLIDLLDVGIDENCNGYSVVLLHPSNISGKIVRYFAKKELEKQRNIYRTCQRYKIRQFVDFTDLEAVIHSVGDKCFEVSWNCVAIIQEIFEPEYTGIAKQIDDGFVVELARGHFVPKGIVSTSQYVMNAQMFLMFANERIQPTSYKIVDGQVLEEKINEKISVAEADIASIVKSLFPVLKEQDKVVEFGVLRASDNTLIPYLIDLIEDKGTTGLNTNLILEGVIASGEITGMVKIIENPSSSSESLHLHYHDSTFNLVQNSEKVVFICHSPDIALLKLLEEYDNSNIGFVFHEGSTLSHLAIILRERGIPSILTNGLPDLNEGMVVKIDAVTPGLQLHERVKICK